MIKHLDSIDARAAIAVVIIFAIICFFAGFMTRQWSKQFMILASQYTANTAKKAYYQKEMVRADQAYERALKREWIEEERSRKR